MDGNQPNKNQQQVQIRIDESKMTSSYANTIRSATTPDEIVLDLGLNLPAQGGPNQQPVMNFQIGQRVVMNWSTAKRLYASLQQALAAYEQAYGTIDVGPKQPGGGGGGGGGRLGRE
jgi:hypothetical protein